MKITQGITKVAKIISRRDNISLDEAIEIVQETAEELNNMMAEDDCGLDELYDIIQDNLGLEPDYFDDLVEL